MLDSCAGGIQPPSVVKPQYLVEYHLSNLRCFGSPNLVQLKNIELAVVRTLSVSAVTNCTVLYWTHIFGSQDRFIHFCRSNVLCHVSFVCHNYTTSPSHLIRTTYALTYQVRPYENMGVVVNMPFV